MWRLLVAEGDFSTCLFIPILASLALKGKQEAISAP